MAIKIFTGFKWGVDEQTLNSGNGLGTGPVISLASGADAVGQPAVVRVVAVRQLLPRGARVAQPLRLLT